MKTGLTVLALMLLGACRTATQPAASCGSAQRGCETRGFALRLKPGDDLRRTLEELAARRQLRAAYVATCAGSLKVAAIRFADQKEATALTGPFEIVSLTGTFSTDGPHLHISVSDAGGRTLGGHLAEGSLVYTTAEVVIVELVACNTEYGSGESCFMRHDDNDAATDAGRARDLGITAAVAGAASR